MKKLLSIFFAVTLSLVVSIVIFPAYPVMAQTTIYVPDDHATIQAAINAASPGDTVYVRSGTGAYNENLIITKSLTLTGEDRDTTIITAQAWGSPAISITGQSNVTISNLTIRNDGIDGVYINGCNNISLINNNIYSGYHEGVYITNSSGISLVDNDIQSNGTAGFAVGVWIGGTSYQSGFNLAGNNIHDSQTGMDIARLLNSTISNNTISNNTLHGISLYLSNGNTFTGNTISNNTRAGMFFVSSSNNMVYNNNFIDNLAWQVFISSSQNNVFNLAKQIGGNYWNDWTTPDVIPLPNGDGFVDNPYVFAGGQDNLPWTKQDGWRKIEATVDMEPDTLNLNGKGKWITCYIELEESYDVADIDVSTIKLNDEVGAALKPTGLGDYDDDGIPDLMVKFDRTLVQELLEVGDEVEIVITGELDGTSFEGTDIIRVIDKGND